MAGANGLNGANGTNGSNGQKLSASAMPVMFGGYWLPSLLALLYAWVLKQWHDGMLADRVNGLDPFKATSVVPSITASAMYLTIVLVTRHVLKDRKAYDSKKYMSIYNLYQVLLNTWCVLAFIQEVAGYGQAKGMTFWGNVYDPTVSGFKVGYIIWVHYNNKFVELLDTAWMLLRKKDKQVSFLHVYHHVLMMWAWLYVCKVECGGDAWFGAFVNSLVHVVMYMYYFLSQLGVPCPWKKYLTMMQMLQFCVCIAQSVYVLVKGNAPIGLPLAQAFVMINMLVLFSQFYRKSYGLKRPNGSNGTNGSNGANGCIKHE